MVISKFKRKGRKWRTWWHSPPHHSRHQENCVAPETNWGHCDRDCGGEKHPDAQEPLAYTINVFPAAWTKCSDDVTGRAPHTCRKNAGEAKKKLVTGLKRLRAWPRITLLTRLHQHPARFLKMRSTYIRYALVKSEVKRRKGEDYK